jgi:hypothetical protein
VCGNGVQPEQSGLEPESTVGLRWARDGKQIIGLPLASIRAGSSPTWGTHSDPKSEPGERFAFSVGMGSHYYEEKSEGRR